jgi:hypothetical protein
MKYRISAVVAMIIAICFSAMAWTPPNNDAFGVDTKGVLWAKVTAITELSPAVNPPGVMSQLMTDANHNWITGLKAKRDGDYYIYETGYSIPVGKEVLFCFYLGTNFWLPDCYYEGSYAAFGAKYISNWAKNCPFNAALGAGHNLCFPATQAR